VYGNAVFQKTFFHVFSELYCPEAQILNEVTQSMDLMFRPVEWNNFMGRKDVFISTL
jgi:hypothetical protein